MPVAVSPLTGAGMSARPPVEVKLPGCNFQAGLASSRYRFDRRSNCNCFCRATKVPTATRREINFFAASIAGCFRRETGRAVLHALRSGKWHKQTSDATDSSTTRFPNVTMLLIIAVQIEPLEEDSTYGAGWCEYRPR